MEGEPSTTMFVKSAETTGGWQEDFIWYHEKERKQKHSYNWKELNELERKRRAILKRVDLPFWRVLLFWDGTFLHALSRDWLGWLTLLIYVVTRLVANLGLIPEIIEDVGSNDVSILGGFLSFFLVIFVNQSNIRFNEMYKQAMNIERSILDVASLTVTIFPKAHTIRIVRYMNAAHAAGYVGLSLTYTKEVFFDELDKAFKLLTPKELERINTLDMDQSNNAFREIITWCMKEVQNAQKLDYCDGRTAGMLRDKVLNFRDAMDSIYAHCDQPIHFYYIHFLSLLSALYLPLFALTSAYSAGLGKDQHMISDIVSGLIVLVQAIFVIGLRLLGQQLMDPFGDDLVDLSVLSYVRSAWESSNSVIAAQFPDEIDPSTEEKFDRSSNSTFGSYAWDSFLVSTDSETTDSKGQNGRISTVV